MKALTLFSSMVINFDPHRVRSEPNLLALSNTHQHAKILRDDDLFHLVAYFHQGKNDETTIDSETCVESKAGVTFELSYPQGHEQDFQDLAKYFADIYNRERSICDLLERQITDVTVYVENSDHGPPYFETWDTVDLVSYYFDINFVCCSDECVSNIDLFDDIDVVESSCSFTSHDLDLILSNEISADPKEAHVAREASQIALGDCKFCPKKSVCVVSDTGGAGFFAHKTDEDSFYQCLCKEGYEGNGWWCEDIDECADNSSTCPSAEDGGFCVDTDPSNAQFPRYKCGCLPDFIAVTSGKHGATKCLPVASSSTSPPSPLSPPSELVKPVVRSADLYLNVNGSSTAAILEEVEILERLCKNAYESLDQSTCSCRNLTDVNLNGIFSQYGFLNVTELKGGRFLQQRSGLFNTTNSTGSEFFQFDFSLYFSFVFTCLGCNSKFFASNDASRRILRGRRLEDVYLDDDYDGVSLDSFREKAIEKMIENGIRSISTSEGLTASGELPSNFVLTRSCEDECDPDTQQCIAGTCFCLEGFFSPSGVGGACQDLQECSIDALNNCDRNAYCIEKEGSFECRCNSGYEGSGTNGNCDDVDECDSSTDLCSDDTICINTDGSYICVAPTPAPTPIPTRKPTLRPFPAAEEGLPAAEGGGFSFEESEFFEKI